MTCPSCGTIASEGAERCPRCGGSLEIPANRPTIPTPVLRAPTRRGELAQQAAGIVGVALVRPKPDKDTAAVPAPPGPSEPRRPAPARPAPAKAPTPAPPSASAGTPLLLQPPPPASGDPGATASFPLPLEPSTVPSGAPAEASRVAEPTRAGDDEDRRRLVVPASERPWPPPPGPWKGHRTSES